MKRRITLSIVLSLIIVSVSVVTGCPGGGAEPTTDQQLATLSTKVAAIEANIGSIDLKAENDTVAWAKNQITDIKNQIAALQSPTNYQPQLNTLSAEINGLEVELAVVEADIAALETGGGDATLATKVADIEANILTINIQLVGITNQLVALQAPAGGFITVSSYLGLTTVTLNVTSTYEATVVFEIIFHSALPLAVGSPGDSINDVLIALHAAPPTTCIAGTVALVPEFTLSHNPTDNTWYLERVTFYTQDTTVGEGSTVKVLTVTSAFGDYVTATVRAVTLSGATPTW